MSENVHQKEQVLRRFQIRCVPQNKYVTLTDCRRCEKYNGEIYPPGDNGIWCIMD
jgi:hypothetical protein